MAEICNFLDFKKQREEKISKLVEEAPSPEKLKIDYSKFSELISLVADLLSKGTGNLRRETYRDKHKLAQTYTDGEIIRRINDFNELEVSSQPVFYSALLDVAGERQLIRPHF